MNPKFLQRFKDDAGFTVIDPDSSKTENEFQYILFLCKQEASIGFGALDSFLSGPDIERRVRLIESEAMYNAYLRSELRDTLHLHQAKDLSEEQIRRLWIVTSIGNNPEPE